MRTCPARGKPVDPATSWVISDHYFGVADEDLKKLHTEPSVLCGTVVHSGRIRYWA